MFGRPYRKMVSQLWAAVAFRWAAVWVLIVCCMSYGQPGSAAALVIVAMDIISFVTTRALFTVDMDSRRKDWLDRLTNRCFYQVFWEALRGSHRSQIDIDALFRESATLALDDIKKADARDEHWDSRTWHLFGGLLSFTWSVLASILYYGSAAYVGSLAAGRYY